MAGTPDLTSQPLVSVVTPVYNGGEYLSQCIESVLAQTYQHWEYVVVNNCSTDRSLEIAQNYARRDSRIRVHSNSEFLSALQNQNHALRQISVESKYCKVVHADDWLFPECLAHMVGLAEANPSVGIVGSYRLDDVRVNLDGLPYPSTVVPGREICRLSLLGRLYVFGSPTSLLLRSELIRGREKMYDEAHLWADSEVCYELLGRCDFGFVHQVLTYTRRHAGAVSSFAQRFNTYSLSRVVLLAKYGGMYLDAHAYEQCLGEVLADYYRFLARSLVKRRGREFWEYHRRHLDASGYSLNWSRLAGAALVEAVSALLCPKSLVRALAARQERSAAEAL